jgi:hypothetical protein
VAEQRAVVRDTRSLHRFPSVIGSIPIVQIEGVPPHKNGRKGGLSRSSVSKSMYTCIDHQSPIAQSVERQTVSRNIFIAPRGYLNVTGSIPVGRVSNNTMVSVTVL